MLLLTKEIRKKLERNHREQFETGEGDHPPVLKLFTPFASATWLISEIDEDNIMFGLCDLGMGMPELGYVSLDEITESRGLKLTVERDRWFSATAPMSAYADAARRAGRLIDQL